MVEEDAKEQHLRNLSFVGEVQTELNLDTIDRKGSIYQKERPQKKKNTKARSKSPISRSFTQGNVSNNDISVDALYKSVVHASSWENNPARNRKIE